MKYKVSILYGAETHHAKMFLIFINSICSFLINGWSVATSSMCMKRFWSFSRCKTFIYVFASSICHFSKIYNTYPHVPYYKFPPKNMIWANLVQFLHLHVSENFLGGPPSLTVEPTIEGDQPDIICSDWCTSTQIEDDSTVPKGIAKILPFGN